MPARTPKKWDLVTSSCTGEPEEYVIAVSKPRSQTIVQVCKRGAARGFKTCWTMNQRDFVAEYQWNSVRHLAGTWEPRSTQDDRQDGKR